LYAITKSIGEIRGRRIKREGGWRRGRWILKVWIDLGGLISLLLENSFEKFSTIEVFVDF